MKLATGNMFTHPADLILVTTNSFVRRDGTLVMGRGAASELRQYMKGAERIFGAEVSKVPGSVRTRVYGVLLEPPHAFRRFGIFQVKWYFNKPAIPELISYSVECLKKIAPEYKSISLNYPGIGNGGLSEDVVWPLIQSLPDNVTVWKR